MRDVPVWRAAEARLLAKRIDELVAGGRVHATATWRCCCARPRDMGAYERALNERGIPTYATGAGGYWGQQQVADLRSYLAALANPRDDLALYNVLASPLVRGLAGRAADRSNARAGGDARPVVGARGGVRPRRRRL